MSNIDQYLGMVTTVASERAAKSKVEFDDLYQEGCLALIESMERLDGREGSKASTFLYHRVFYACFDLAYPDRRSKSRQEANVVTLSDPIQVVQHEGFNQVDAADEVVFLEGRLNERQREIVRLRADGMLFREIATKVGLSKQRTHNIYAQSVELLQENV